MAVKEILEWVAGLKPWQQDAFRRVATSLEFDDEGLSPILNNLLREHDIPTSEEPDCHPLTPKHLIQDADEMPVARLCALDEVQNANRLATGQVLPFAPHGITLIYGGNGSGKSGYCRILKKICRALVKDTIYSDVFLEANPEPAQARIRFKIDGKEDVQEEIWLDGNDSLADVAHLSVFDSHNARLYVDARNSIDYLPYEIELLTRFGQTLTAVQNRIGQMITEVDNRLRPGLPAGFTPGTRVHKLAEKLQPTTPLSDLPKAKEIAANGKWDEDLAHELEALNVSGESNPKVLASKCRRVSGVLKQLQQDFTRFKSLLSEKQVVALQNAMTRANKTAKAAQMAAKDLFSTEPLPHVGSGAWQQMFRYAKEYSVLAYPGVRPPATQEGDLCLLCQQPLSQEASERLLRFEEYVAGEAKKDSDQAAQDLDELVSSLKSLRIPSVQDINNRLAEFREMSTKRRGVSDPATALAISVEKRRAKLVKAKLADNLSNLTALDFSLLDTLREEEDSLNQEARVLEAAKQDPEQEIRSKRLSQLKDTKHLADSLQIILARRQDLELRARLKECERAAKTNAVSHKANSLRQELVSERLRDRIHAETEALSLTHLHLAINDDSRRGESGYKVSLDAKQRVASKDVLSEGEQRALGLACFLADINGQPKQHGIIVDDPVSSLDHIRLRQVAKRLVQEAGNGRQVIIFTHNLLFFSEVLSKAASHASSPVPVVTHVVREAAELGFGVVEQDDEPWEGKPVTKRIAVLREHLNRLRAEKEQSKVIDRKQVVSFYTGLRETWERLVEEVLLGKVVERFGTDVRTLNLKRVVVDDEDYRKIFWAMKEASESSGHDMPAGKNIPLPSIDDMEEALRTLDEYRASVRKRSNDIQKKRKMLEEPPKAQILY